MKLIKIKGKFKIKEVKRIYYFNYFKRRKIRKQSKFLEPFEYDNRLIGGGFYGLPYFPRYFESFIFYGSKGFSNNWTFHFSIPLYLRE